VNQSNQNQNEPKCKYGKREREYKKLSFTSLPKARTKDESLDLKIKFVFLGTLQMHLCGKLCSFIHEHLKSFLRLSQNFDLTRPSCRNSLINSVPKQAPDSIADAAIVATD
jgi:hypothetical protein